MDCYDKETKTLRLPIDFIDFDYENIPKETEIIFYHDESKYFLPLRYLPYNVTQLTFGRSFNLPFGELPPNLTHLTFGTSFNQKISIFPQNLTHLTFGFNFNQKIDIFPQKLTHLVFNFFLINHYIICLQI